jgi:beta-galactosidase
MRSSRRRFLGVAAAVGALVPEPAGAAAGAGMQAEVSLCGAWEFRATADAAWMPVEVPHTWQVTAGLEDHRGRAWYRREIEIPAAWAGSTVRVEFEAVFHSARVTVNGQSAGEHLRKGYTAFRFDITRLLRFGARNTLAVEVDNAFDAAMLPRARSSDWAHDGGIVRPVTLLVSPPAYLERIAIDADPDVERGTAAVALSALVRNSGSANFQGTLACRILDDETGLVVAQNAAQPVRLRAGEAAAIALPAVPLAAPRLWHFDHPHLYVAEATLDGHAVRETFGIRKFEVRDGGFYLNGERVTLMGVERMAGSHPDYGMAEPASWIAHDHDDLKELNCVFTRVHWPQDRRVLDYCDRHGILMQTEVPAWGGNTFQGMTGEPSPEILNNGLEQLQEMIARDAHHPCLFAWGLCNEVNGQNPAAAAFARRLLAEAKKLDPRRLCSYASNSLQKTPGRDVSGEMDFIEWNEYYGSWSKGSPEDVCRNLDEIHAAFPSKPVVISEYGYCACTPDRPEGDQERIRILRGHTAVLRAHPASAGMIFFDYNDYRTHVGDQGVGALQQRVHGVVDVYGRRKPSFAVLRDESSPVAEMQANVAAGALEAMVRTRERGPGYTLRGYVLRGIAYAASGIPVERQQAALPDLKPGAEARVRLAFAAKDLAWVQLDVVRPTGFSAFTVEWRPAQ